MTAVPYICKYYTEPLPDLSPLHCFLNFITGVVNSILSHITPIFYTLLSLYLIMWPPRSSQLSRSNSQSFSPLLPQQVSYVLSTLSKKWLGGWIITVNTTYSRISYLFSKGWFFKYHRIHSCCLKPFHLPPTTYHKKRVGRTCEHQGTSWKMKPTNKGTTNS